VRAKLGAPCGGSIVCDAGLCDEARTGKLLATSIDEERSMDGGLRTSDLVPEDGPLVELAALYSQGPLPRELAQRNARLAYAITPEEGPNCGDDMPTGAPCVCAMNLVDTNLCALPLDGGTLTLVNCMVRANDPKKRIEVTRSCAGLFSGCEKLTCCPGYQCESPDGASKRCVSAK
jgi:hypothetical protein